MNCDIIVLFLRKEVEVETIITLRLSVKMTEHHDLFFIILLILAITTIFRISV